MVYEIGGTKVQKLRVSDPTIFYTPKWLGGIIPCTIGSQWLRQAESYRLESPASKRQRIEGLGSVFGALLVRTHPPAPQAHLAGLALCTYYWCALSIARADEVGKHKKQDSCVVQHDIILYIGACSHKVLVVVGV